MTKVSLSNEEIAQALVTLGDCTCPMAERTKPGTTFNCHSHGRGIITAVDITSFGDNEQEMLLTIRFYA